MKLEIFQPEGFVNRRKHERYAVTDVPYLKGVMLGTHTYGYLVSISRGGCGFYSRRRPKNLNLSDKVVCHFEWSPVLLNTIQIEGRLLYSVPKDLEHTTLFFTGIEFYEEQRFFIDPLIDCLENMSYRGVIESFLR